MANVGVTRSDYVNVLVKDARENGILDVVATGQGLISAFKKTTAIDVIRSLGGAPFKTQTPIRYQAPYGYKSHGPIGATAGVPYADATSSKMTMAEWIMMMDTFKYMFDDGLIAAGNKYTIKDHVQEVLTSGTELFNNIADTKLHTGASGKICLSGNAVLQTIVVPNIYLFQGCEGMKVDIVAPAAAPVVHADSVTISIVDIPNSTLTFIGNIATAVNTDYIMFEDSILTQGSAACQYGVLDGIGTTDVDLIDTDSDLDYGGIDRVADVMASYWKGKAETFATRGFSFDEFDKYLFNLFISCGKHTPDIAVMNEKVLSAVQAQHRRDMTKVIGSRKALNEDIQGLPYLWYGNELLLVLDEKVPGNRVAATVTDGEIWVLHTPTWELQQISPPKLDSSRTMAPDLTYPVHMSWLTWFWNFFTRTPNRNLRCSGIDVTK